MKPSDRRARLYDHQKDRPFVEQIDKSDPNILKWVRVAKHIEGAGMDEEDFVDYMDGHMARYDEVWFIHDKHPKFEDGKGPMCIVGARVYGKNLEPHVDWFPWASPRNILRCAVSFFMLHRRKGQGNMVVYSLVKDRRFYDHLGDYVPLFPAGKIPDGDPLGRGDEYRYYIQGRGSK